MNNEEEDNDPQEVFVAGDYADFNIEGNCTIPPDSDGFNAAFVFALLLFVPMALTAFFASFISRLLNISFGDIGVPLLIATALIVFLFLLFSSRTGGGVSTQNSKQNQPRIQNRKRQSRRSRSSKKFNNIEEYENSPEFDEDEAEKTQAYNDDIELAVDALLRLKYGTKGKCKDWVERGIKSGILSNQTDRLVKYALTRGAVS